ncbi:MAG: sensor histidine kinase [Anaerolineales bacterium]|jgi:signal transduction histidine kinase|nr:sensor histidine kinase [Anaerolineales bacterium]
MHSLKESTRILRTAAWIWIGFLLAMALMDFVLYTQTNLPITQNPPFQQLAPGQQLPPNSQGLVPAQPNLLRNPFKPVYLFYGANGLIALLFLIFAHSTWIQIKLGKAFYPLLLLTISTAPIIINVLITPRFPQGPLANAEGMALRQLPVLFVALALVAWEYELTHVIFFSIATTTLELSLIYFSTMNYRSISVFIFIAIIRMISFIAVGVFISLLVTQLRQQRESLRDANANLTHYASTLEQLTVSRERNRLARELHDTLAHSLTAISVSLETAKAYFDIDSNKTRELIDKSLESTRIGVDETRRALKALRSSSLEDMGLGLAIQRAAESAAARFHLNLTLDLKNPMPSLSPDVEQTIYRIAQECIENIINHSRAKNFSVSLQSNGHTTLTIQDDGIGFDMKSDISSGHFGLVGMHERAELVGGKLKIESPALSGEAVSKGEKGKGTKVVLTI